MSALTAALLEALASRRERDIFRSLPPPSSLSSPELMDFTSNDYLGLSTSPILRGRLLNKLQQKDNILGSGGSRLLVNPSEHALFEDRVCRFLQAEAALLFNSGFDANVSFFACIPQKGDLVVYDEYIHASIHDGLKLSRIMQHDKISFEHNSIKDLKSVLSQSLLKHTSLRLGKSSLFISVESLYSMDGTFAPLVEIVQLVDELFPLGNAYLIVDEAHCTGIYGPQGRGRVAMLGLEDKVFARLHTFGKALGATGAVYVTTALVRTYLINYARPLIFTTSLSTLNIILADSVFDLLEDGTLEKLSNHLQHLSIHFVECLLPHLRNGIASSLLRLPSHLHSPESGSSTCSLEETDGFLSRSQCSQIFPLLTPHAKLLSSYLLNQYSINARPIVWPTVPKGTERVRVCLSARMEKKDVERLVGAILRWVKDMGAQGKL